ncbi:MAG: hypothetical protein IKO10_11005, partial [Lachnospiraceae bacterium]|nr:hypothetical protein [Lachnospiraceae bacterium]
FGKASKTALSAPASMYTPQTFVHLTRPSGTLPSRGGQEFFATATELDNYEFINSYVQNISQYLVVITWKMLYNINDLEGVCIL